MTSRRAFTLLEVMLALAIILVLAGTVYTFLFDLIDSRDRVMGESDRSRTGIGAFEQLERDIMTTVAGSNALGTGIRGSRHSIELLSRGVTLPIETDAQTVLGDMQGVSFAWDGRYGTLSASRWDVLSGSRATPETISDNVAYLQLRYYDGSEWRGSFTSTSSLPVAIELALWFGKVEYADDSNAAFDLPPGAPAINENDAPPEWFETDGFAFEDDEIERIPVPPRRAPDRVRVMLIPDGPSAGWEGSPS